MHIKQSHQVPVQSIAMTSLGSTLPSRRSLWPADAQEAFSGVLGELNNWSKEFDWPITRNVGLAEEAVRQTWNRPV